MLVPLLVARRIRAVATTRPSYFFLTRPGVLRRRLPGRTVEALDRLGPDALSVTAAHLHARSRGKRVSVKSLLLDQGILAGVGNIYADEALFLSAVRPTRRAGRVTREEYRVVARVPG